MNSFNEHCVIEKIKNKCTLAYLIIGAVKLHVWTSFTTHFTLFCTPPFYGFRQI